MWVMCVGCVCGLCMWVVCVGYVCGLCVCVCIECVYSTSLILRLNVDVMLHVGPLKIGLVTRLVLCLLTYSFLLFVN